MRQFRLIIPVLGLAMSVHSILNAQSGPVPPVAPQRPHREVRHREPVEDPYFWLREKDNPAVIKHLQAENGYTEALTAPLKPFAAELYQEMVGRIQQTDLSVPTRRGNYFYYTRTEAGKQYPIHCRKPAGAFHRIEPNAPEEVLLDLNAMAIGHPFFSLGAFEVSADDALLLYSTDTTGYRQYDLHIKDLRSGNVLTDTAQRVTSAVWALGHKTLFYTTEDPVTKRSNQLWRLMVGGSPVRVYQEKDELYRIEIARTKDKAFLLLEIESTDTWEVRYLHSATPSRPFKTLLAREKGHKYSVEHRAGTFYIRTNKGAKDFQVVTAKVANPEPSHWRPFLPSQPGVLVEGLEMFKHYAVAEEKVAGLTRFRIFRFQSETWHEITFPEPVYAAGGRGTPEFDSVEFRFNYQSMVTPPSTFDYNMVDHHRTLLKQEQVLGYDASRYVTERFWAVARDGVKVPMSVVYAKGVAPDGKAPLWLYAYGSYGFGSAASFDGNRLSLLDRGMVWVTAHIRGGNELGEAWHEDGMLLKKMNTFTDFIDCADWLVANRWTSRDRLVIEGGSAGGLLMGAVANLRPDLCKAVHLAVPFVDVLNTMLDPTLPLTVGEYLEWGDPNQKAAYAYMKTYSPYDNLAKQAYPAMLVTTSLNDSQVGYWEPAKYVARLRTLKTDANPLLLKIKLEPGGHGGASGRYDRLKDKAFEYAWMLSQVGITK